MRTRRQIVGVTVAALLTGCAGQTEQLTMQGTPGQAATPGAPGQPAQPPQQVTFPNGTTFGGASGRQASALAQIVVESNNNNMKEYQQIQATQSKDYQQLQGTETKNLQTSQQALQMLEQLSNEQGTGQITLFFATGEATIPAGVAAVHAARQLPRLSVPREPGPQGSLPPGRERLHHREPGDQRAPEPGARHGARARHRPVPGQRPPPVLQGLRARRRVQPQGREPDRGPALPERPDHRRLRHQPGSGAPRRSAELATPSEAPGSTSPPPSATASRTTPGSGSPR